MRISSLVRIVFLASWPFAIYFGLEKFEPKQLAFFILFLLLLHKGEFRKIKVLKFADWFILVTTLALAIAIFWSNSETLLRLYPVVVSLGLLTVFTLSLFHPPTIIERIARTDHHNLSSAGVRYTMYVTRVWCVFFLCNALAATGTALFASREVWVFYNGFLSYLFIAIIFCSEWFARQRFLHHRESA